jgi:hypothetical protein
MDSLWYIPTVAKPENTILTLSFSSWKTHALLLCKFCRFWQRQIAGQILENLGTDKDVAREVQPGLKRGTHTALVGLCRL